MWKLTDYLSITCLVLFGLFFANLSYEQDKWHDIELAALKAPVLSGDIAWLK